MAASFSSSVPGFKRISSGAPITPTSCSKAAISMSSRSSSATPICAAQPEQVSATRKACPATAAFLHSKAANKPAAIPSRACTNRSSIDSPNTGGRASLATVIASRSLSKVWSSAIQRSADSGAVTASTEGSDCGSNGVSETLLIDANFKGMQVGRLRNGSTERPKPANRQTASRPIIESLGHVWTWGKKAPKGPNGKAQGAGMGGFYRTLALKGRNRRFISPFQG